MSLINDALKQAQKNQPPTPAGAPPPLAMAKPLQPVPVPQAKQSSGRPLLWVILIVAIGAIGAVVFLAGRATALKPVAVATSPVVPAPAPDAAIQPAKPGPVATVTKAVETPPPPAPVVITASDAPRVQGIFYVPGKATAILDGKTVRAGDRYQQYQVKEIAKASVTLVTADGKVIQLAMAN